MLSALNVGAFTASVTLSLLANTPFSIDMLAETFIQSASLFGSASIIGPRFVIDPLTPNADQYSIQLSPGLGNGAVVPLPPAIWLFGSALGAMGGWAKRKQAISNSLERDAGRR